MRASTILVALMLLAVFARPVLADAPSGDEKNFALDSNGGVASASGSTGGNGPEKANDGDNSTFWESDTYYGWLAVAFADNESIGDVHVHFDEHAAPGFDIYLDTDGDGAYEADEKAKSVTGNDLLDYKWRFAETVAKGVKVDITAAIAECGLQCGSPPCRPWQPCCPICVSHRPKIDELEAYLYNDEDGDGLIDAHQARANSGFESWYTFAEGFVNLGNGNALLSHADLRLPARGFPLTLARSYNSQEANYSGPFGYGWTFPYDARVAEMPNGDVVYIDEDGSYHTFLKNANGTYQSAPGLWARLTKEGGGSFTLKTRDGTRKHFGTSGLLLRTEDRNGNNLTLTWSGGKVTRIADDSGLYLDLTYDSNFRVTKVADPMGRSVTYTYDGSGRLTTVTDPLGNQTSYTYDADSRVTDWTDKVGRRVSLVYDASARVTEVWHRAVNLSGGQVLWSYRSLLIDYANATRVNVTNARGVVTTVDLNGNQNPVRIAGPTTGWGGCACCGSQGAESVDYSWDAEFNRLNETDGRGNVTSYAYDGYANLVRRTDATGNETTFGWQVVDNATTYLALLRNQTNPRGFTTSFEYDDRGNMVRVTDAFNSTSNRSHDDFGFLSNSTDFEGHETDFTYDTHGWLTETENPLGFATRYAYDALGRRVNATTSLNFTTAYEYDALDRRTRVTDPLGNSTSYEYDARGDLTQVTDPNGYVTQREINVTLRKVFQVTDASGNMTVFDYDPVGNSVSVTNPRGYATTYEYDTFNRMINETRPGGNYTRFTYDANGNVATRIDPNGNQTSYEYDALNRLVKVTYPNATVVTIQYDPNGNVIRSTGFGYTRTESWDPLDRRTSTTYDYGAFNKTVGYGYDADSRRTRMNYSDGSYVTYAYNAAGWLAHMNHSEPMAWAFEYDSDGRRALLKYPNFVNTSYEYDAASRITEVSTKYGATTIESFTYEHDKAGNRVKVTEDDGTWVQYAYDTLYRMTNESYSDGRWIAYEYDANGNRVEQREKVIGYRMYTLRPTANGAPIDWSQYPTAGQNFDKVDESAPDGDSTYVHSSTIGHVDNYVVLNLTDVGDGSIDYVEVRANARATQYQAEFPASIRLGVDGSWGTVEELSLTYIEVAERWYTNPATGQPWTVDDLQGLQAGVKLNYLDFGEIRVTQVYAVVSVTNPIVTTVWTYAPNDQLLREETLGLSTTSYAYDRNGNMKTRTAPSGTTTYEYDPEDRLISVDNPTNSLTFSYSTEGRRLKRVADGTTTFFGYDFADPSGYEDVIEEYSSTGSRTTSYVHGLGPDEPVGLMTTSWYYHHRDALGSVTRITDGQAGTAGTYRYDAFGAFRVQTGADSAYGFTSRESEGVVGLYYHRARYYDPGRGRFLGEDPIGLRSGTNRYAYVGSNPANRIDPSGLYFVMGGGSSGSWLPPPPRPPPPPLPPPPQRPPEGPLPPGCSWWEWGLFPMDCTVRESTALLTFAPSAGFSCVGECLNAFWSSSYGAACGGICALLPIACVFGTPAGCAIMLAACVACVVVPIMYCVHDCFVRLERGELPRG